MPIRAMTSEDIPAGLRLKEIAGWNQTEADWKRFLTASPQGCFVAEVEGKVCGTATVISYENRFAWIGMVLVDPDYRSRGFGTQLLQAAIQHLDKLQIPTIKLDATPQGKPIYERLGFGSENEIERWTLRRAVTKTGKVIAPSSFESVPANLLKSVLLADREIFGADRSFLLKDLHGRAPHFSMGIFQNNSVQGYAFGRQGSFADHLGPWMATNSSAARSIVEGFLARSTRDVVVVDCMKSNAWACNLVGSLGFVYSRPLTRMFRGTNKYPGQTDNLCAILGPEFG